jgi:hypothetical protein
MFLVGLSAASLALLEYCLFVLYTHHIGGFGTNFPAMLASSHVIRHRLHSM